MDNRKDLLDQIIVEDLMNEAKSVEEEMAGVHIEVPAGLKEELRKKLHAQIDEYERERVYAQLSEEDKMALELGRKMLEDKASEGSEERIVYHKKNRKVYVAVALVALLVLAMGVTSIGGAEKIAKMIGIEVGNREVVQVNNDEDNYIVMSDNEEEAYQEMRDVFGIEVVKIFHRPDDMNFVEFEVDEELQSAFLKYEYKDNVISYFVNAFYMGTSWGMDIEDKITEQYYIQNEKCKIKVTEYEKPDSKANRYLANYTYNGLEYCLVGVMEKSDFEYLLKNLNFF